MKARDAAAFVAAIVLLAAFLVQVEGANRESSPTYDEVVHLPAGVAALHSGDFRLNTEHPPLAKGLAALALHHSGAAPLPEAAAHPAWEAAGGVMTRRAQWVIGHDLLFARGDGMDAIVPARRAIALLALLLGVGVFVWARSLYGNLGGLLSLGLFCFSPTLIAHSSLVTTDLAGAAFTFAAGALLWWAVEGQKRVALPLAGLAFGAALASRFTTLLAPLLFAPALMAAGVAGRRPRALLLVVPVVAWATIWAVYGFDSRSTTPLPWDVVLALSSPLPRMFAEVSRAFGLLPEPFVFGLLNLLGSNAVAQPAYFLGEIGTAGLWRYVPSALALKSTLGAIALTIFAIASLPRAAGQISRRSECLWLLAPAALHLLAVMGLASHDLGVRHALPTLPFLFVLAGRLMRLGPAVAAAALLGLLAHGAESVAVGPHPLSFFHLGAGGPAAGHRHLVDSDLDWGQALPALAREVKDTPPGTLRLAYFGSAPPSRFGIAATGLPGRGIGGAVEAAAGRVPLEGTLAVSATVLHSPFADRPRYRLFLDWLATRAPDARPGSAIFVYRFPPGATWPSPAGPSEWIPTD